MKTVVCVIPAYNEGDNIVNVLDAVASRGYRPVVVNDGSNDHTAEAVARRDAVLISHIVNRGQGAALQTGNEWALAHGADIIVHFDADGQFQAEEIAEIIQPIEAGEADIVFGSRFQGKHSKIPLLKRIVILPAAKVVNFIFFGFVLSDPQCGFRALSAAAARSFKIEQDGMAHCSEIMAKAFAQRLRIREVPVTVIYRDYGQKFSGGLKIIKDLLIKKIIS